MKVDLPAWRLLLPETVEIRREFIGNDNFITKLALWRVGCGIGIKEAISAIEYHKILKEAKKYPKHWVAQRKFESVPVVSDLGEKYHLCLVVFTVDGKMSGLYARTRISPRIDELAIDTPVLVEGD